MSNDNPYSESLFRTVKYWPNYPNRPFKSKEEACQWVSSFVDWYNHQHRHCGEAIEICRQRSRVYELLELQIPNAGADQFVAGNNLIWYGLMNH